jgi:hypothetical protein
MPSCSVRITPGFGLPRAISFLFCLNNLWIRTTIGYFFLALSKSPLDSDYQRLIPSCPVQITSGFGLPKANSFVHCPNHLWIRTSKGLISSYPVQITSGFGLPKANSLVPCPNHLWIWTTKG